MSETFHLSPDAPTWQLLSLRHNPLVVDMTPDQLRAHIQRIKELATSAPTLSAKLANDSEQIKPKRTSATAKAQALRDAI